MQDLVRAALREGALGFSTSQLDIHVAHDGRGVPSNHAAPDEVVALAGVLAEFGHGAIEIIPRSFVEGMNAADRELLLACYRAAGRPLEIQTLTPLLPACPDGWEASLAFAHEAWRQGARIHPMLATNRLGAHLTLGSTFLFDELPSFRETLTLPPAARARRLLEPAVRERMRRELADPTGRAFVFVWDVVSVGAPRVGRSRRPRARRRARAGPARLLPRSLARRGPGDAVRARDAAERLLPRVHRAPAARSDRHGRLE